MSGIQKLTQENQNELVRSFLRHVYPLYTETGVTDYECHFIGTCFALTLRNRSFFVFTEHQYNLACDGNFLFPELAGANKFMRVSNDAICRISELDLAFFEITGEYKQRIAAAFTEKMMAPVNPRIQMEFAVLGCHTELNVVKHSENKISVTKAALITEQADLELESPEFYCSGGASIAAQGDNHKILNTFGKRTQGLSGSPIIAYQIGGEAEFGEHLDMRLIGVATHVSEKDEILYGTHHWQIIQALAQAYDLSPDGAELGCT